MSPPSSSVRLYVLVARAARRAVIFRRGPSRQVALVSWRTDTDAFEVGQWMKGRIYERRCDLSPNGELLAYFAAKWTRPLQSWTAISRPPWLTALALWPKGDAWGGGALFHDDRELHLNHRPEESALAEGFSLPRRMRVAPLRPAPGRGEDDPIWHLRRVRDGWIPPTDAPPEPKPKWREKIAWTYERPLIYSKPRPRGARSTVLEMRILGVSERNGSWYVIDHAVVDRARGVTRLFPRSDWAEWDVNGDLLLADRGKIWRLPRDSVLDADAQPRALVDLAPLGFEARESPPAARRW